MATTISLDPQNVLQMSSNYSQSSLQGIYEGNPNIENFKYRNAGEDNDLAHAYVRIRITDVINKGGHLEHSPQEFVLRADDRVFNEWADYLDDIDEVVLFLSSPVNNTEISAETAETVGEDGFYLSGYSGVNFSVMAKTSDGTILSEYNWGYVPLNNCTFSTYTDANGNYHYGWAREFVDGHPVFWWEIGNNNGGFAVYTPYLQKGQTTEFMTSHDVYKDYKSAYNHLKYGTDDGKLDENGADGGDLAEDREVMLYYESFIFKRGYNSSITENVGSSAIHFRVQYKNNKGEQIVDPYRAICGYVAPNNEPNDVNHFGNIIWVANRNINIIETKQNPVHGTITPSKTIPSYNHTTGFYPPYIDDNTIYDARYSTNMRIFANEQDALNFIGGGNPTPIGESGNQFNPSGFVGDKTVYNTVTSSPDADMSSVWILNQNQVNDLANIFATGLTVQESETNGILTNFLITSERSFFAHSEPINAVVDLFWLPFDPSEFVNKSFGHIRFVSDKYGVTETLANFVDSSGATVKSVYNNPISKVWIPGGQIIQGFEAIGDIRDHFDNIISASSPSEVMHVGTHHME